MKKIIAIANQKGGVGKTTTAVNLAVGLANQNKKVLCIDLDPQGNLSDYLDYDYTNGITIAELLKADSPTSEFIAQAVVRNSKEKIDFIPADIKLSSLDMFLSAAICRESRLRNLLKNEFFNQYDYIMIDTLPSLGLLMTNALTAADSVIIPVQLQKFSLDGLRQFETLFNLVKNALNPNLRIEGILQTMTDNTNIAKSVSQALQQDYNHLLFETSISKLVEASNSTAVKQSLINSKGSRLGEQYMKVVDEMLQKEGDANDL